MCAGTNQKSPKYLQKITSCVTRQTCRRVTHGIFVWLFCGYVGLFCGYISTKEPYTRQTCRRVTHGIFFIFFADM